HDHAERAGSAAALLGAGNFLFGAVIAPVTGAFDTGSAVPMASVMVGCGLLAVLVFWGLARPADILAGMPWGGSGRSRGGPVAPRAEGATIGEEPAVATASPGT